MHAVFIQRRATGLITCSLLVVLCSIDCRSDEARNRAAADSSVALQGFLKRFDPVAERGFIRTQRAGATGIGYTLESLLNIDENNSPQGDLLGMEIKAYRDSESRFDDHDKMNLFLKEPEWLDSRSVAERIQAFGYVDPEGRHAWYQSVTSVRNSSGLQLKVDRPNQCVLMLRNDEPIARWTFAVLAKRLHEKHTEAVFVAAETRGEGRDEEFHFRTVTYCASASVERLVELIEDRDVVLELRMHVKPTGGARNHGTAFRVRKHRLVDLYEVQQLCRPIASTEE